MYLYLADNAKVGKSCEGTKKCVLKWRLKFEDCKNCNHKHHKQKMKLTYQLKIMMVRELYNEVKTDLKVTMVIYHNKSQQNGIKFQRWEENPDFWFS